MSTLSQGLGLDAPMNTPYPFRSMTLRCLRLRRSLFNTRSSNAFPSLRVMPETFFSHVRSMRTFMIFLREDGEIMTPQTTGISTGAWADGRSNENRKRYTESTRFPDTEWIECLRYKTIIAYTASPISNDSFRSERFLHCIRPARFQLIAHELQTTAVQSKFLCNRYDGGGTLAVLPWTSRAPW